MSPRPWRLTILALCGSAAASSALSLGFGRIPDSTVFGQPLDLVLPLRLDAGESLSPACLSAEVSIGEQRVPAATLQLSVERADGGSRLRLRSPAVVLEPLVSVNVAVGCNGSVARQFVVFADPPGHRAEPSAMAAGPADAALPPAPRAASDTPRRAVAAAPSPARRTQRNAGPKTRSGTAVAAAKAPRKNAPAEARRAAPAPRLQLDEPEERLQAARLAVAAQDAALADAEKTALAAQAAASAAETRLAALEQDLRALRADSAADRATTEQLRQRLAAAERSSPLTAPLLALLALLGAITLWLGLRLRALQRERQAGWWQVAQAQAEPAAAEAAADAEVRSNPTDQAPVDDEAPARQAAKPDQLIPEDEAAGLAFSASTAARPLSVDELIDLEQQADFFVVLGEDASAIDLLMTHLRGSGGVSPLPYLKLLEIYRRGGDREAYERIRKRFNQRFNAVAPSWEDDLQRGRGLLDYPAVLDALQAAWPEPLDAMAALENLLFRKHGGELFELPAYRDVLSLYAVARDLHRHVDDEGADVDVLLPLGPMHEQEVTARLSIFDRLDGAATADAIPAQDRPTAPIDLDLSEPGFAPQVPLEVRAPVRRPRRRRA